MQTIARTVEILSEVLNEPRSRVNAMARRLIDDGLLPKSSGRAIKKISAGQMLYIVAAVAMADTIDDASQTANHFAMISPKGLVCGSPTLYVVFGDILDETSKWVSAEVEFGKHPLIPAAIFACVRGTIRGADGAVENMTLRFNLGGGEFGTSKRAFVITAAGIEALRSMFNADN